MAKSVGIDLGTTNSVVAGRPPSSLLRLGELKPLELRNSKLSVIAQGEKTWEQLSDETSRFLKR